MEGLLHLMFERVCRLYVIGLGESECFLGLCDGFQLMFERGFYLFYQLYRVGS